LLGVGVSCEDVEDVVAVFFDSFRGEPPDVVEVVFASWLFVEEFADGAVWEDFELGDPGGFALFFSPFDEGVFVCFRWLFGFGGCRCIRGFEVAGFSAGPGDDEFVLGSGEGDVEEASFFFFAAVRVWLELVE